MSWIDRVAPGLKGFLPQRGETPDNLWIKCPESGEMIFRKDLEAAHFVTPAGHHMRIGPTERFAITFDGEPEIIELPAVPRDPLRFRGQRPSYTNKLDATRRKIGRDDAMAVGAGQIHGVDAVVLVQDFAFMGGSLGMAAGEAFVTAADTAVERGQPLVAYTASGGARMQEGALSLMQMPRTVIAVQRLREAGLPYIVVFTDPTTGGVTASFAMLGDVQLAEPGALIGFAGPRVIEQTIREKLPKGFQRSEYLREKGMVDRVVHRRDLKRTLANILSILIKADVSGPVVRPNGAQNGAANGAHGLSEAPPHPDAPANGAGHPAPDEERDD